MKVLTSARWLRLAFSVLAFLMSWWSMRHIYQGTATGADENSYVFQAHNFAQGRIAQPTPPLPHLFRQHMIINDERAGWLSRYPPGHPLWLTPGVWLGSISFMVALAAAAGLWFLSGAAGRAGLSPALAAALLLCSPFFLFMFGTHLSHTSGFMAVSAMLYGYLGWLQSGRRRDAALAGLAWSFFFLNRTYTALLIAVPFGLHACSVGWRDRRLTVFQGVAAFAGCAAAGVAAYLLYNFLAVGDPFTATYLYYAPTEGLGFGPRRLQGNVVHHTWSRGIESLRADLLLLNQWLYGVPGSLLAALALGLVGFRRWTWAVMGAAIAIWFGYVLFWFRGITVAGGPSYYFETLPFLILLTVAGAHRLDAIWPWSKTARHAFGAVAFLALACASVRFTQAHMPERIREQKVLSTIARQLRTAPPHSLILVEESKKPSIGGLLPNPKGLASDPLLLRDPGSDWPVVARIFSDRKLFRYRPRPGSSLIPMESPLLIQLQFDVQRTKFTTGRNQAIEGRTRAVREASAAAGDQEGWLLMSESFMLPQGRYHMELWGRMDGVEREYPLTVQCLIAQPDPIPITRVIWGATNGLLMTLPVEITNRFARVAPLVRYYGSGEVQLHHVSVEEQPAP